MRSDKRMMRIGPHFFEGGAGIRNIFVVTVIILSAVSMTGCATIINGTSQKISVLSEPTGASVAVDGQYNVTTPAKVRLERRIDHTLVFTKKGYHGQSVKILHVLSEAVCGNMFLGGPVGWAFDACAGTQYKLIPNPVHVELKRSDENI